MSEKLDPRKQKRLERIARQEKMRASGPQDAAASTITAQASQPSVDRLAVRFTPVDTWFFRESRPHNAVGASELGSLFPPPPRTLAGALRTLVGDTAGFDWRGFSPNNPFSEVIGYGDDLGPLAFDGPWLDLDGERLFPTPVFLFGSGHGAARSLKRLEIGDAVLTDLRTDGVPVHLPMLPKNIRGYRSLEGTWINSQGMGCLLAGGLPGADMLRDERQHDESSARQAHDSLLVEEPRLGIARENFRRTAVDAQLYQTRHLRPHQGLGITFGVRGLADYRLPDSTVLVRLGGEGRMAAVSWRAAADPLPDYFRPKLAKRTKGLILILLTSADLSGDWLPTGFKPCNGKGCWRGDIAGIPLTIHSAVLGKARREGGWDQAASIPRAVRSLVPAGSAWYCTVDGDMEVAIAKLHGAAIGCEQTLGRGRLAVGLWVQSEFPQGAIAP
jgi:CRISPR-associated protein Cmr3